VLGITKAYTTRVGEGPFPTELKDAIGDFLGERGHEFGTVTGRKRRCGWFDAALVRQAVANNGIDGIALTKLDVLDGLDELKICVGYRLDGEEIDFLPASQGAGARRADLRDAGRLEGTTKSAPALERAAGAGGQVCPPYRGTDRRAGGAAVHQPRAGRHHTCDRSFED
jgi:hypothetical protein